MTDQYGNGFTTKEIVIRLEEKMDDILADHEERIRSSEGAIFRIKGALVLISILLPVALALLAVFVPHG